jgi:hypothetical protein
MKKILLPGFSLFIGLCLGEAVAQELPRQIVGFNLQMSEEQVHARLKKIGTFVRAEKGEEAWKVKDPSFSHVIVGFGKDDQLRYVTAVARTDKEAKPMAYSEIGDLKKAQQIGDPAIKNFQYEWPLQPEKGESSALVLAMGRDPKVLSTLTLKNPEVSRKNDDD